MTELGSLYSASSGWFWAPHLDLLVRSLSERREEETFIRPWLMLSFICRHQFLFYFLIFIVCFLAFAHSQWKQQMVKEKRPSSINRPCVFLKFPNSQLHDSFTVDKHIAWMFFVFFCLHILLTYVCNQCKPLGCKWFITWERGSRK